MMKLVVTFIALCTALAFATNPFIGQQQNAWFLSAEQAYQQLLSQPLIAFYNSEYSSAIGYYVTVPYNFYSSLSSESPEYAQQFFIELQKHGYLPIINYYGYLAGFYIETPGINEQNKNVNYYISKLSVFGLTPIVNRQYHVIGLYYSYPNALSNANTPPSGYNYFASYGTYAPENLFNYQQYYPGQRKITKQGNQEKPQEQKSSFPKNQAYQSSPFMF